MKEKGGLGPPDFEWEDIDWIEIKLTRHEELAAGLTTPEDEEDLEIQKGIYHSEMPEGWREDTWAAMYDRRVNSGEAVAQMHVEALLANSSDEDASRPESS